LELSAMRVAGEPHRGRRGGEIIWHGRQPGQVHLAERKLKVQRIRLRRRGGGAGAEVAIPAYEALKANDRTGARMLEILLRGVSTRNYAKVLPEMAESVGISRSAVSREFSAASEAQLKAALYLSKIRVLVGLTMSCQVIGEVRHELRQLFITEALVRCVIPQG
jgi:AraC-like DNA-binding protein